VVLALALPAGVPEPNIDVTDGGIEGRTDDEQAASTGPNRTSPNAPRRQQRNSVTPTTQRIPNA
jgi:hypothetical protein